ncbi:hypothetical protein V3C99_010928 [Haemonchus contortus]
MFFRCMFMLWLLSLPDVSIQGKRPSVCDTTMKERESEDFSPCIKFNWELKDCSKLKIERGYVSRSKMGLNVCQAKDGGWLECTCEQHSLCIAPALKKLRVLSRVFGDTCEPEIRNELDQKKKEWNDESGDEKKQWSDGDGEENAADSVIENNDTEETDPEDHVNADQVTTTTTKTTISITRSEGTKIHNHPEATASASEPTPIEKIATKICQIIPTTWQL